MTTLTIHQKGFILLSCDTGAAWFSPDRQYRWRLTRRWEPGGRIMTSIGQNASTADHETNDMTITKDMEFARLNGCNALIKVNLGSYITKDPHLLRTVQDPVGALNSYFLAQAAQEGDLVVAAWGAMPNEIWARFRESVKLVKTFNGVKCFGRTKTGAPRHTSRIGYNSKLEDWKLA